MMKFKKTYTIEVEIDMDDCQWDTEWGVEDWECSELPDFMQQLYDDVDQFIKDCREA